MNNPALTSYHLITPFIKKTLAIVEIHVKILSKKINMNFRYTALGPDNQKFTGSLQAMSLESAREKLHKMDLSIISLEPVSERNITTTAPPASPRVTLSNVKKKVSTPRKPKKIISTFYFVATNSQGKQVNGTIDAKEPYLAYKRLISEYKFKILDLFKDGEQGSPNKNLNISFEEWNLKLKQEGFATESESKRVSPGMEEPEKMASEIVQEIDSFIKSTKEILKAHQKNYSRPFLVQIEKKVGNLERIRTSNNLKHITQVCKDLYELIAHPELAEGMSTEERERAYEQAVADLGESGFIQYSRGSSSSNDEIAEGFGRVKKVFGKIEKKLHQPPAESLRHEPKGRGSILKKPFVSLETPKGPIDIWQLGSSYWVYFKERNPILKHARKQEFNRLYEARKALKAKIKTDRVILQQESTPAFKVSSDYSELYAELNSFIGWLLFFYIAYFFVASFSLERNVGLAQDLVVRTLSSPLIINIFIFLLMAHLALKIKLSLFHKNAIGSAFLFLFTGSLFALVMANF